MTVVQFSITFDSKWKFTQQEPTTHVTLFVIFDIFYFSFKLFSSKTSAIDIELQLLRKKTLVLMYHLYCCTVCPTKKCPLMIKYTLAICK